MVVQLSAELRVYSLKSIVSREKVEDISFPSVLGCARAMYVFFKFRVDPMFMLNVMNLFLYIFMY